jgi:two-component system CheB/CheR fusion protein
MSLSGLPHENPVAEGLPLISPDAVEQDHPEQIDNVIPTQGYDSLPLVGLGGSAGGISALRTFFTNLPPNPGMAFVVVLHLSPDHESTLPEVLARSTSMPVVAAIDGEKVLVNHVYVIPPGKFLTLTDGELRLTELEPNNGRRVTVDLFFRALADTHGPHATAVVLSGADGDGALGIKRIKERGGLTIAQDPEEAEHSGMPRSAIETGMVDWVLQVKEMPGRLIVYRQLEKRLKLPAENPLPTPEQQAVADTEPAFRDVLAYLRNRTGRDFSYYKRATIVRRLSRRMQGERHRGRALVPGLSPHPPWGSRRAAAGFADQRHEFFPRSRRL